jgi:uncharacterized membrane protein
VATITTVRAALTLAGLAMAVPLILYFRAFRQGRTPKNDEFESAERS